MPKEFKIEDVDSSKFRFPDSGNIGFGRNERKQPFIAISFRYNEGKENESEEITILSLNAGKAFLEGLYKAIMELEKN